MRRCSKSGRREVRRSECYGCHPEKGGAAIGWSRIGAAYFSASFAPAGPPEWSAAVSLLVPTNPILKAWPAGDDIDDFAKFVHILEATIQYVYERFQLAFGQGLQALRIKLLPRSHSRKQVVEHLARLGQRLHIDLAAALLNRKLILDKQPQRDGPIELDPLADRGRIQVADPVYASGSRQRRSGKKRGRCLRNEPIFLLVNEPAPGAFARN